jgi:serine/threonine-protein kinase
VVHRDLKPANVLLTPDGTPKVSDFGLAKPLDASSGLTEPGQVVGTWTYMAPEQADPRRCAVGPWTDIYALGVMLFELLTGRPPFKAATPLEGLRQVLTHEPAFPRRGRSRMERDLQTVCLKCLEKSPARRYASAAEVADRLRRVAQDRPIPEQPPGWRERAGRLARRHPLAVGLVFALLGAAAGVWGFTALTGYLTDPRRVREDVERRLAADEAVTLIGATGPPGYFEWAVGEDATLFSTAPQRPFAVSTTKLAMIEFPYAARLKRYRLRAEVRHDESGGTVGLYCGRKPDGAGRAVFMSLTFADRGTKALTLEGKPRGRARLELVLLEPRGNDFFTPHFQLKESAPFFAVQPAFDVGPWRELVLEVTPETVRAYWRLTPEGDREFVGEVTVSQLRPQLRVLAAQAKLSPQQTVDFAPHGGFGLFVRQGGAAFRGVVVEPVGESP